MPEPRVVAIVQARMASTRLPGKVLADLGGQPVLAWVLRRTQRAALVDQVVVATTVNPEDDAVAEFCRQADFTCYRGSAYDVLDRYYQAAQIYQAGVIVRITGDCPLIDPEMLDDNIRTFLDADPPLDFAANRLPGNRTVPIGLDTEICTMQALATAWREAQAPHEREHVMPFFYEHSERFKILHIRHEPDYGAYRWTVDTPEDMELLRQVVPNFEDDTFSWEEVLAFFQAQPELAEINASVQHRSQHDVDERGDE
jgi:spore coat polysaccharide biosynthesis protein SpsF